MALHLLPFTYLQMSWIDKHPCSITFDEVINTINFFYKLMDRVLDIIFGTHLLKEINGKWKLTGTFIIIIASFSTLLDFVEKEGFFINLAQKIYMPVRQSSLRNIISQKEKKIIKDISHVLARVFFDFYYNIPSGTITLYYILNLKEHNWLAIANVTLSSISFIFVLLHSRKSMHNKCEFICLSSILWVIPFALFYAIPLIDQFYIPSRSTAFTIFKVCLSILIIFVQSLFKKYMTCYLIYQTFPKSLRTEQLKTHIYKSSDGWLWVPHVTHFNTLVTRLSNIKLGKVGNEGPSESGLEWDSDVFSGELSLSGSTLPSPV